MIHSIESEWLSAKISEEGAELYSLLSKKTNTEYLWQGDSAIWSQRAPVLFPIVGRLKDGKYIYNDKNYKMSSHGFVANAPFTTIGSRGNAIVFTYESTPKTRAKYPFVFTFRVAFTFKESALETTYQVINKTNGPLYFSCGSHEGYRCPREEGEAFEDYYLEFNQDADYSSYTVSPNGLLTEPIYSVLKNQRVLPLQYELFNNDSLVFANIPSNRVILGSKKSSARIEVSYGDCPNLVIWTQVGAPYICIEPWYGLPDFEDSDGQLTTKQGIISLEKGDVFSWKHTIKIIE